MSRGVISATSLSRHLSTRPPGIGSRSLARKPRNRAVSTHVRVFAFACCSMKRRAAAAKVLAARASRSACWRRLAASWSARTSRPMARRRCRSAASLRAAANVRGAPITGSSWVSALQRSTGPRVNFAGLPFGRRKRSAHDLRPLGWIIRWRPGHPPSGTSRLATPGKRFLTAAAVSVFFGNGVILG